MHPKHVRTAWRSSTLVVLLVPATIASADVVSVSYDEPSLDRWMYVFNGTPGFRGDGPVFSSLEQPDFSEFDQRDGQVLIAFDTTGDIPTGLPASSYHVESLVLTVMVESDQTFAFDPTYDEWRTYLPIDDPMHLPDDDIGRPVIVTGVGYRNQYVDEPFPENGPFDNVPDPAPRTRNAFPISFVATAMPEDVSNNVEDQFDVTPFGVGQAVDTAPGALVVNRTDMVFTIDVSDPDIACYLGQALSEGRLDLMLSSLHLADVMGGTTYPVFYFRENFAVPFTADPARLAITVDVAGGAAGNPADIDGNGVVDILDLLVLLSEWGPCGCCAADINNDSTVNVTDLLALLGAWN